MTAPIGPDAVDLARCAEIAAHLAYFPAGSHLEVVARFGLRWQEWEAASARWKAARDADLGAGRTELSSQFVRTFAAVVERLQVQIASLESIGPVRQDLPFEPPPPGPPPLLDGTDTEAPFVEVARTPAGAEDLGAPSFWSRGAPGLLAATAGVSVPAAPAMPFAPASGPAGDALDRAIAHAEAVQGPRAPAPPAGDTVALLDPPGGSLPAGAGNLSVEQYTSLRVELQLLPTHAEKILARYGIRPEDQAAVFAHWSARLNADPPLRMSFIGGYAKYLAWLRENPGALEAIGRGPPVGGKP
jgi:hypothetical protein